MTVKKNFPIKSSFQLFAEPFSCIQRINEIICLEILIHLGFIGIQVQLKLRHKTKVGIKICFLNVASIFLTQLRGYIRFYIRFEENYLVPRQ